MRLVPEMILKSTFFMLDFFSSMNNFKISFPSYIQETFKGAILYLT